jgi:hypothetical protein
MFSELFKQQKIVQAVEMGALDVTNPSIVNKILETLQVPGFANVNSLDAKLARRRLDRLKMGEPTAMPGDPVSPSGIMAKENDKHLIHFEIISNFTKTTEFEVLEEDVQRNILILMAQHQFKMMQAQQQAVAAAQQTRGTGPQAENAVVDSGAITPQDGNAQQIAVA